MQAKISKSELGKKDKFYATIVTLMYLCYPVLIKSTFRKNVIAKHVSKNVPPVLNNTPFLLFFFFVVWSELVACMPIGVNTYLQRDLNIRCWETDSNNHFTGIHFTFVLYLFLPGITLWVIGMPCEFFIEDFHFAFFILFTTTHNIFFHSNNFYLTYYFHSNDLHYIEDE